MKALTLHQPWASLIADGRKKVETRSWPAPRGLIGQRIAIHAGKTIDKEAAAEWYPNCAMQTGAVLCTAILDDCGRIMGPIPGEKTVTVHWMVGLIARYPIDEYGDFYTGRWLWRLAAIELLTPPIPARGHQKVWEWDNPPW